MLVFMRIPPGDRQLVQIVDAALADAARRAGPWLACRIGCTQCCYGAFAINALDAARLHEAMKLLRAAQPLLAMQIEQRAQAWIEQHGPEFPGDLSSGRLGETATDQARFEEFANEAACPALDPATGRCDVYAARPMTCRVFGPPVRMDAGAENADALGHCELCFHGVTEAEVKSCEMTVPHDLEAELVQEMGVSGETLVAFALLKSYLRP